ncbi:ribonuclease R [Alicyclobacillus mengziensis]|uniref:Ribonuclease R n=1 Tax=Alicyclobacillus mengziensis TaxID=2931921 RepID=A0A9X7Z8M6_9BACL|nr:ribonuclease R [Alicyclobacillus mengziensis]QSO48590.1 ribonuclease R [Alicyclobacillus mengziensis]
MNVRREDLITFMEHEAYRPMKVDELVEEFNIEGADDFKEFVRLLNDMEDRGDVVRTRTNRYGLPERMNLVVGTLQMKARGFGFVIPEAAGEPDVYVASGDMNGAMSGDKVMVRVERSASGGNRREGKIIRVLERGTNRVVGKFTHYKDHAFVTPLDKRFPQDIYISAEETMDAHDGYVVVVEITSFPTATRGPEGKVVEVLGHPDAPGIDILAVVRKYQLPEEFPEDVLKAAEEISLDLSEEDLKGRRDLRHQTIVTIDGEDAKDLDDAVHVKALPNGNYELGVHIADVGYYVKEGSPLDKEAFERGTSVYLVDRVIPMLPQRLSNNICSLNPHVDRITMSCVMEITPHGEVVSHEIFPSLIKTTERMTYTNVNKILVDKDEEVRGRYQELISDFERMGELAEILRNRRMVRGAIDFDFEELKVLVDDLGHPTDIVPRHRSIAEKLIEEFMLVANETVAEHFYWMGVPFIYRIHEEPDLSKMMDFNEFIHNFGYHVKGLGNKIHPRALQDILQRIDGTREETVISRLMLRSMRQAKYSPDCVGHFGLAAEYYTHFTSPIRRYPDLSIHRIMREVLMKGELSPEREEALSDFVYDSSLQASIRERIAQDAEREVDQMKMVEYMLDHVGEEFHGIISGVTQFGLFIQLDNGVEGLIHISYLTDDYYVLNEKQMALVGERTRRVFRLGDPVTVEVAGANKEELTVDFQLVAHRREGTMVRLGGVESVVYDEDLSPKARRRQIADRLERASEPRGRGQSFRSSGELSDDQGRRTGRYSGGRSSQRRSDDDKGGHGGNRSHGGQGQRRTRNGDSSHSAGRGPGRSRGGSSHGFGEVPQGGATPELWRGSEEFTDGPAELSVRPGRRSGSKATRHPSTPSTRTGSGYGEGLTGGVRKGSKRRRRPNS